MTNAIRGERAQLKGTSTPPAHNPDTLPSKPLPKLRALAGLRSRSDPRYRDWTSAYASDLQRGLVRR